LDGPHLVVRGEHDELVDIGSRAALVVQDRTDAGVVRPAEHLLKSRRRRPNRRRRQNLGISLRLFSRHAQCQADECDHVRAHRTHRSE